MFIWRRLFSVRKRAILMAMLPLLSLLSLFTPLFSTNVSAVTGADMKKKSEVWIGISSILEGPGSIRDEISAADANSCNFYQDSSTVHGPRLNSSNLASVGLECAEFLKAIGYSPPSGTQGRYKKSSPFNKDSILNTLSRSGFSSQNAFYGGNLRTGVPSDAIAYAIAINFLEGKCSVSWRTELLSPIPPYNGDPTNDKKVDWMNEGGTRNTPLNDDRADTETNYHFWMWTYRDGKAAKNIYYAGESMDDFFDVGHGTKFMADYQTGPRDAGLPYQVDCYQAGRLLQDNDKYAKAYAAVLKPGSNITPGTCEDRYGPGAEMNACVQGFTNKANPTFCTTTFPAGALRQACEYGRDTATGTTGITAPIDDTGEGEEAGTEKTTCAIELVGWIICPVVTFLAKITDGAYSIISNMLEVQPLNTTGGSPMFNAWSIMRNFANIMFVIAFLVIIFSQITSVGLSNYGIKKMLPKLIVAAVLVNVSYWICAAAVDISNILGSSVYKVIMGAQGDVGLSLAETDSLATNKGWSAIAGPLLAGTFAGGAMFFVTLSVFLPMLVVVLATIVSVFLALILRQAFIIILIVISPIAFVSMLLPNTSSFAKNFFSISKILLMIYPVIGLVFAGSALASTIIMASSDLPYIQIVGAAVAIVPLVAAPALMKVINGVGSRFGLPNVGVKFDKLRKGAESYRDYRKDIAKDRRFERAKGERGIGRLARRAGPQGSRRQRTALWLAGAGVTAEQNKNLRRQSAERAAKEDAESYVVGRVAGGDDAYARKIAGPTGDVGKVKASAVAAQVKEFNDNVNAEKATMSRTSVGDISDPKNIPPDSLHGIMRDKRNSVERRAAAAGQLMKVGGDKDIHAALDFLGTQQKDANGNFVDSAISSIQQQVASDMGARKPVSLGGSDMAALNTGNYDGDFTSKIHSRLTAGKISAETLAKASPDELKAMNAYIQANAAALKAANPKAMADLKKDIDEYRKNKNITQPTSEVGTHMDDIQNFL